MSASIYKIANSLTENVMVVGTLNAGAGVAASPLDCGNNWSAKFANKTLQDYEVLSVIGNGAFGTCYKVRDKETGELYAWKGMDYDELSDEKKASLVSEISVLRQLEHPNIVQYYHHLVNHEAKSIYIVMECCEGGDLAQLIARARAERKRFEEKYIWRVLFQICKALQVCHNKINNGTILHRDIKPANIFLDAEGNAKLGDFGLARMLRRDQPFAATFVGTPYYMSPEIVKGVKYDRKSDVWAVGCLIYELCALQPPFKGREFEQLSANISNGKFSSISEVYSSDLQEIISFMLEVDNDQRPGIEVITRHPLVVRNISHLGTEYPQLVIAEKNFYMPPETENSQTRCKLTYSPMRALSSTVYTEQNSFNESYGQRRLSISGIFTPDLRSELFYSAKRRIFAPGLKGKLQRSDPALYESLQRSDYASIDNKVSRLEETLRASSKGESPSKHQFTQDLSPSLLTRNVFDNALQARLHAIRAQESLLKQRAQELDEREQRLNEQEQRLQKLERTLKEKVQDVKKMEQPASLSSSNNSNSGLERARFPLPYEVPLSQPPLVTAPPVPPRKPAKHDDTYCTIETNDSMLQQPTVAKLNLAALPVPKSFPTLRKVTFQSPQKFIKYDIENVAPAKINATTTATSKTQMQTSVSSKGSSDDSADSHPSSTHRRKSILSLFGLSRNKDPSAKVATAKVALSQPPPAPVIQKSRQPLATMQTSQSQSLISKTHRSELTSIWTKEQKRAAFDLLAAMNAAEQDQRNAINGRHKFRQSVRERNTLLRNRMRRSLIVGKQQTQAVSAQSGALVLI